FAPRCEEELIARQRQGTLQVRSAAAYRELVCREGLAEAYRCTDVVVAANADFTDQASLLLLLGPSDPPIRIRRFRLGASEGLGGHGNSELLLPIGLGGAAVLDDLLAGHSLPLSASGVGTAQQPRLDLDTRLSLGSIGAGRLLLHRAVAENGVVAVSSREGLTTTPWGPVLGPLSSALTTCSGAGSIGMTMPGLSLLGPGSPLLVAGAIGWVSGAGSGHNPRARRQASGHALSPGAAAALAVELHTLQRRWLRPTRMSDGGSGLLVAIAAPVPLINGTIARQAACGDAELEAPVLDFAIPRRVRPSLGMARYSDLNQGRLLLQGRQLRCAPAHSPRLAAEIAEHLSQELLAGRFPLRLPLQPLPERPALLPLGDGEPENRP
ncbi:MAG: homocysteine biosynthesis protein, partial [Vulcanococcus sp.]